MAFRDDSEALLARVASLEQEAEEARVLRERTAQLEEDNRTLKKELDTYHTRDKRRQWWKEHGAKASRRLFLAFGVVAPLVVVGALGLSSRRDARLAREEAQHARDEALRAREAAARAAQEADEAARREESWRVEEEAAREKAKRAVDPGLRRARESQVEADREEAYQNTICAGLLQCRTDNDAFGTFDDQVTADIAPDGAVKRASYRGNAPTKAKQCIIRTVRERRIADYDGGRARIRCMRSGTLLPGTKMIMSDSTFERLDERWQPIPDSPAEEPPAE